MMLFVKEEVNEGQLKDQLLIFLITHPIGLVFLFVLSWYIISLVLILILQNSLTPNCRKNLFMQLVKTLAATK